MAIVTRYGNGYPDPASQQSVEAINAGAELRVINSFVPVVATDSPTSVYKIGRVPSNGSLDPGSVIYHGATGATVNVGVGPNATGLMSAYSAAAAGSAVIVPAANVAAVCKQKFWQLAGLASDPGGMLDVFLTIVSGTLAAADIGMSLKYTRQG